MQLISIIMPLHNKGPYVTNTLHSVQGQSYEGWECIVVDNGSSDDGPEIVASIAAQDPRIRVVNASTEARGPGAARNFGLDRASGVWVLFLDADDLLNSDHLAVLSEAGRATDADIVAGGWQEFVEPDVEKRTKRGGPKAGSSSDRVLESAMATAPWAVHAALVRREWLVSGRQWPEELDRFPSEDTAFWFRVLIGARLTACPLHFGAIYRTQTPGHRDVHQDMNRWVNAILGIVRYNECSLAGGGRSPSITQAANLVRVLEQLLKRCLDHGMEREASAVLDEANRWLKQASGSCLGMKFRSIIGVRMFVRLRNLMRAS